MHIVIAPNAFKNSLSASAAATAIQRGLEGSRLGGTYECFPVGDGGDGTGDLIIARLGGKKMEASARDPLGRRITTYWGLIDTAPGPANGGPASGGPEGGHTTGG